MFEHDCVKLFLWLSGCKTILGKVETLTPIAIYSNLSPLLILQVYSDFAFEPERTVIASSELL